MVDNPLGAVLSAIAAALVASSSGRDSYLSS